MPRYSIEGNDGRTYSIDGPVGASEEEIWAAIQYDQANPPVAPRRPDDGFLDVLGYGVDSALNRAGATWDTLTGDLTGVEESLDDAAKIPVTDDQRAFRTDLNSKPEGGFTEEAANLFNAVVDNPGGAWDELVGQLPNSVPAIGGLVAGAKAGAMAGIALGPAGSVAAGTIGAIVGAGAGIFLGTAAIEMGAMAQSKVGDDGFTSEDRAASITGGVAKSATITAFEMATLGLNKYLGGGAGKAAYGAVSKFLTDKGVDVGSAVAVKSALVNKAVLQGAIDVATKAATNTSRLPGMVGGFAGEAAGEGLGEYYGEAAAGNDPSMREAMLEAGLSMPQSVVETAIGRSMAPKENAIQDLSGQTPDMLNQEIDTRRDEMGAQMTGQFAEDQAEIDAIDRQVNAAIEDAPELAAMDAEIAAEDRHQSALQQGLGILQQNKDITETDTRVADAQKARSAAKRMTILSNMLGNKLPATPVAAARNFSKQLASAKFRDTAATREELELIKRAFEAAAPAVSPVTPADASAQLKQSMLDEAAKPQLAEATQAKTAEEVAAGTTTDMEALIPEKKEKQSEPAPVKPPESAGLGAGTEGGKSNAPAGTAVPVEQAPAPVVEAPAPASVGTPDNVVSDATSGTESEPAALKNDAFAITDPGTNNGKPVEVVQNPKPKDYQQIAKEVKAEFPNAQAGEPTTRFTIDDEGNRYIWKAHQATHAQIEPGISTKVGSAVDQNNTTAQDKAAPTEAKTEFELLEKAKELGLDTTILEERDADLDKAFFDHVKRRIKGEKAGVAPNTVKNKERPAANAPVAKTEAEAESPSFLARDEEDGTESPDDNLTDPEAEADAAIEEATGRDDAAEGYDVAIEFLQKLKKAEVDKKAKKTKKTAAKKPAAKKAKKKPVAPAEPVVEPVVEETDERVQGHSTGQVVESYAGKPYVNRNPNDVATEEDTTAVGKILQKVNRVYKRNLKDVDFQPEEGVTKDKLKSGQQAAEKSRVAAAKTYFSTTDAEGNVVQRGRIIDRVTDIVYDFVQGAREGVKAKDREVVMEDLISAPNYSKPHGTKIDANYEAMTVEEFEFFEGKGGKTAQQALAWARENLSPEMQVEITRQLTERVNEVLKALTAEAMTDSQSVADRAAADQAMVDKLNARKDASEGRSITEEEVDEFAADDERRQKIDDKTDAAILRQEAKESEETHPEDDYPLQEVLRLTDGDESILDALSLPINAINSTDLPLSPFVKTLLQAGNIKAALADVALNAPNALVRRVASGILKNIGDTKVKVLKDVKNRKGKSVAGSFDPKTNTIKIKEGNDVPIHVLIHEAGHAVLSHTLDNKSHPLTKKLQKLYDDVKDDLSSHYGSESLQEFVAESQGNTLFQQELASMYAGKKSDLPAWRQFLNAVTEFFQKLLKIPSTGTYAQFNDMIIGMMSPAPETRNAGEYFMMSQQEEMDALVTQLGKGADATLAEFKKRPAEAALKYVRKTTFHDIPYLAKRGVFGFFQTMSLSDATTHFGIDGTRKIHDFLQMLESDITNGNNSLDTVVNKTNKWLKDQKLLKVMASTSRRIQSELFNRVMPEMSLWGIDATVSKKAAIKRYTDNLFDTEKRLPSSTELSDVEAKWDELQPAIEGIGQEGVDLIRNHWDAYGAEKDELLENLTKTIDATVKDPAVRNELKDKVFKHLLEKANIDPYSPLWRKGEFHIAFVDRDNNENGTVYESYETPDGQNERYLELKKINADTKNDPGGPEVFGIQQYEKADVANFNKTPPSTFIRDSMAIFEKAGVDENTKKLFMDLFIQSLPETSYAKSFHRRKGSTGYEKDSLGAFQHTAYRMNRQIQQLKYSRLIRDQLDIVHKNGEEYKAGHDEDSRERNSANAYLAEWDARVKFALNPDANWVATASRWFNRFAFMWTIGFGPSSAIINTGQLPMVVYPFQAMKTDVVTAYKAMAAAGRFVMGAGGAHQVELMGTKNHETVTNKSFLRTPSGDNYYIRDYKTGDIRIADESSIDDTEEYYDGMTKLELAKLLQPMIEFMSRNSMLDRTVTFDTLGLDISQKQKNVGELLSIGSAWMFHTGERLNRQVAMLGAYLNELKLIESKTNKKPSELSAEVLAEAHYTAMHDTQYTNGGSLLSTAPRWAQKNVGRIAMMYKSFGVLMYTLQGRLVYKGLPNQMHGEGKSYSAAEIKLARKQFFAIQGATALMSGIQGLTMFGWVAYMYNLFKDDDDEDFETLTRNTFIGELGYKGGINYMSRILGGGGVDVAARIGLSNLIMGHNRYGRDASWEEGFMKMFGGPAYGSASSIARGFGDLAEGETRRGIEAMMPAGLRNMFKVLPGIGRYSDEGIRTRRGDPIMGDLTPGLYFAQFLGFAPAEYMRNQERSQVLKGIDRSTNDKRSKLLRKMYVARRMGGSFGDIMEDVREFNMKHPYFAIDAAAVKASMKTHMKTSQNMYNGVLLSPRMRRYLLTLARQWHGGI